MNLSRILTFIFIICISWQCSSPTERKGKQGKRSNPVQVETRVNKQIERYRKTDAALIKKLNLSPEQQQKHEQIIQDLKKTKIAASQDASTPQFPSRVGRFGDEIKDELRQILTPEQQVVFDRVNVRSTPKNTPRDIYLNKNKTGQSVNKNNKRNKNNKKRKALQKKAQPQNN